MGVLTMRNMMEVSTMMNKMKVLTTLLMVSGTAPRIIFQQQPDERDNLNGIIPRGLPSNQSMYCPDDLNRCDEPYHYPEHDILKAVAKQKKAVKIMFDKENVAAPENKTNEIGLRMFESEFENICDVDTTYIKPRAAKNKAGKFCHHPVPPGVPGPQAGRPQCHRGGVGGGHLLFPLLLYLPYQHRVGALAVTTFLTRYIVTIGCDNRFLQ